MSRPEIARVRGVAADSVVAGLVERGLIAEAGREDGAGGAVRYKTTPLFERVFGLDSLSQLPRLDDLGESTDEIRTRLESVAERRSGLVTRGNPWFPREPPPCERRRGSSVSGAGKASRASSVSVAVSLPPGEARLRRQFTACLERRRTHPDNGAACASTHISLAQGLLPVAAPTS